MFWKTTYGFFTKSITSLADDLSQVLQIKWQERDSDAWGDYYLYPPFQAGNSRQLKETFRLYLNHISFEGWKAPDFKDCGVLLSVTTERPLEIDKLLYSALQEKIVLIQRSTLEG
ncbi:MAG: hypothetical protein ABI970_13820 [Chloroflexota bacterium]